MGNDLKVALKEWDFVIAALLSGRQTLLLRKGGIAERRKGFTVQHTRFLLFPSYVHQQITYVKPDAASAFQLPARQGDVGKIRFEAFAEVVEAITLDSDAQTQSLAPHHIWNDQSVNERMSWESHNPTWLILVRAFSLSDPIEVEASQRYTGCRSWVTLEEAVQIGGATSVLNGTDFRDQKQAILDSLGQARV